MYTDIHPYEGNEPFIFISYAHKDKHLAKPILQWLSNNNYRVWVDTGIHSGEFASKIAERLEKASCVIALLTDNFVESINCRNEINYASMHNTMILPIRLKPTVLRHGMDLQLVSYHFIDRHQMDESRFYELLTQSPEIQSAHTGNKSAGVAARPSAVRPKPMDKKHILAILCACMLVVALCVIGVWIAGRNENSSDPEQEEIPSSNQPVIRDTYLTANDEDIIIATMISNWKPLAHLGYDVTVWDALSRYYDDVSFSGNTVTAQKGDTSMQFSVCCRINADGSYSVDDYLDNVFYDCYIDGSSVEPAEFERYFCSLITGL